MNLSDLNRRSERYKTRRRVGRGIASGMGKTSARGQKGQKSRSGYSRTFSFEGGQIPLFRKLPKRGFNNVFRTLYDVVNIGDLNRMEDGATVDLAGLVAAGLIKNPHGKLKILGDGALEKKLTVVAAKFTATARRQIEQLGGEAREV
jgi:large subunit ribosomal protein L15